MAGYFADVSKDTYYFKATQWANEQDMTTGIGFDPDYSCTRADAVDFMWKMDGKPESAAPAAFTDVPDYYADAVAWAVEQGVTTGTSDTTFSPSDTCTRGQIVTFLWRAAGCPTPASSICAFTDLDSSAYYYTAVLWAVGEGVTNGTTATTFSPDAVVTRSQTVAFLWRYAGSTEMYGTVPYTDVPADAYYYDAVLWANENDITNGTTATTFSPDADCTRAQIVTFMYRYMGE